MSEPQVIPSVDALIERTKEAYPYWSIRIAQIRSFMAQKEYGAVYELLYPPQGNIESYYTTRQVLAMIMPDGTIPHKQLATLSKEAQDVRSYENLEPLRKQLFADFCHTYLRR